MRNEAVEDRREYTSLFGQRALLSDLENGDR